MRRIGSHLLRRGTSLALLLACFALLSGCGDDPEDSETSRWSPPAEGAGATGDPDGTSSGVRTAEVLLAALASRLAEAPASSPQAYQEEVRRVAEVLWPLDGEGRAPEAAGMHAKVALIAGDTARWVTRSPEARADWERNNPTDVKIYEAFKQAVALDPEAYAAWCADEAPALLTEHADARQKKHFGG